MATQQNPQINEDLKLINSYTRREFKEEEVYTFSVILCDNLVDRDYESFSIKALNELAELFVGKTGILNHERKSENQTARIYKTQIIEDREKETSLGEIYTALKAWAYIPKTEKNSDLISKIESGILKEVSISCNIEKTICSICQGEECSHQKGKTYNGKLCVKILDHASDAYEFSFVAVPAQRKAGVVKYVSENIQDGETIKQTQLLKEKIEKLEKEASWGKIYREKLENSVRRYGMLVQKGIPQNVLESILKALDIKELESLEAVFYEMAQENVPIKPQLFAQKESAAAYEDFVI